MLDMTKIEYFSFHTIYNTYCTLHFISDKVRKRQVNCSGVVFPRVSRRIDIGGTQSGARRTTIGGWFKGPAFLFAPIGLRLLPKEFEYEGAAGGLSFGKALWLQEHCLSKNYVSISADGQGIGF